MPRANVRWFGSGHLSRTCPVRSTTMYLLWRAMVRSVRLLVGMNSVACAVLKPPYGLQPGGGQFFDCSSTWLRESFRSYSDSRTRHEGNAYSTTYLTEVVEYLIQAGWEGWADSNCAHRGQSDVHRVAPRALGQRAQPATGRPPRHEQCARAIG